MALPENLILKQMELGPMANYVYLIGDEKSREVMVVDPAWETDVIISHAQKAGYTITGILLTHGHPDHINGVDKLVSLLDIPVYISQEEPPFFRPKAKNLIETSDHQKIKIGGIEVECLHTPGHTPGCQCFKYKHVLLTGDTLFINGCGRCDLPGGDPRVMYNTLYNILMKLPDDTVIYTGHRYASLPYDTMGHQKKTNPYLTCQSLEEFLQERMGFTP